MHVTGLSVHQLELPLTTPYHLALGDVTEFETIVVEANDGEGGAGFGEATVLTGYTAETIAQAWTVATTLAEEAVGLATEDAIALFGKSFHAAPFTVTALTTALEMLEGHEVLYESGPVPLLALVNETEPAAIEREVEARIGAGYGTLKVKVGWEVAADLKRVAVIQKAVAGRAAIRIDANQGYSQTDAITFVSGLTPDGVELVEQTCAAGDWEAAQAVHAVAEVPIMLDESIYDLDDIDRAAELEAADYIKLKLMKAGGLTRLADGLQRIRDNGMKPVLGNGVASDLGCWMEACVARRAIDNAGEMNGYLKIPDQLLATPLVTEGGALLLGGDATPALNAAALAASAVRSATFPAG
ncbi:MAG: enolase C-terminal domain-like protein [Alphaproteobacteria bacterium]|nr:enolase C-terminal domain-like protein [Alphaproteobacteria bacterium]